MGDHDLRHHQARRAHAGADRVTHPGKATNTVPDSAGWDGQPYKGSVFDQSNVSPALTKAVEQKLAAFDRYAVKVEARLADVQSIGPGEAESIRNALMSERAALQELLVKLPTGSPLMKRGFQASDRVTSLITRLESVSHAQEARVATAADAAHGDEDAIFQSAAQRFPLGYCDTAPQGRKPCNLDPVWRAHYRTQVRTVVGAMHTNYGLAINALKVEEKLRKSEVSFEQALGELLLGVLFQGLTAVTKAAVHKGISAAEKALTQTERIEAAGVVDTIRPDKHSVEIARKVGDKIVEKSLDKLKEKATKDGQRTPINTADLAAQASGAIVVPADREGFLQLLKSAPTTWHNNITSNLDYMFDADLAALALGLSNSDTTQAGYEDKIRDLLTRFDQQVMAIAPLTETTVMMVALPDGRVRQALVSPETAANPRLQGEWKNAPTKTGKWKFVRWIDENMREMAVARASQRDATAAAQVRWARDANFWDAASMTAIAETSSSAEGR